MTRPPHFHLLRSIFSKSPGQLTDLPTEKIQEINQKSGIYYEDPNRFEDWKNKPFSDTKWAPWSLWRFGLLLSALRLRPGDRVLDFGCGTGWTSIMLAQMGAEVVGIDVADSALQIARENANRVLSEEQLSRLKFEHFHGIEIFAGADYFDFVIVFEALHHLPNPKSILQEFSRVSNEYGYFAFAEPGLGHASAHCSAEEAALGILEEDLDLERLYQTGMESGFRSLDILVPALSPDTFILPMDRLKWFLRGLSWLIPADFVRSAIINAPLGIFRKSKHRITSLHPKSHAASIQTYSKRISIACGLPFVIETRICNLSDTVWLRRGARGRGYVRPAAHLLNADGEIVEFDFGRCELPHDVNQSDCIRLELNLTAPRVPGDYIVKLDMVNEGICWFEEERSPTAETLLHVS
ncbi:methyltransferase domain-containing protein [bacterium]|nr:methyltransferase domain-containing protein [bacterium]